MSIKYKINSRQIIYNSHIHLLKHFYRYSQSLQESYNDFQSDYVWYTPWRNEIFVIYKMRDEYGKLGQSLFFFYATRLLALGLIFYAAFAYVNDFYTHYSDDFSNHAGSIPYDRMVHLIQSSTDVLQSISEVSRTVISQGLAGGKGNYCTMNLSVRDCQALLLRSIENQLIYSTYSMCPSFHCEVGDCLEVASLWDYFWTFKIRMQFIDYLLVEYALNGSSGQRLIAPPCSNSNITTFSNNLTQKWNLQYSDSVLALTMVNNSSEISLKVTLVFDSSKLMQEYSIFLSNFDFPANTQPSTSTYLTYIYEGRVMFGYQSYVQPFIFSIWVYTVMTLTICMCCLAPMLSSVSVLITQWQQGLFKQMQALDNLYQYQINTIFQAEKPKKSVILSQNSFTFFYEDLSQIVDKECEPLLTSITATEKQETFKFTALIDKVMNKFQDSLKPLQQQRGKEFTNLKPLIRSSITEISESVQRRLRDLFIKSRQMTMTAQFFHFGYHSVLQSTPRYEELLARQKTPLPDAMLSLFRYMNHTINSGDLKFAFKFAFAYNHIIEQQIIMRLQDALLPKYLDALRNLDVSEQPYRERLGLGKRIANLDLIIENKRHISAVYLK